MEHSEILGDSKIDKEIQERMKARNEAQEAVRFRLTGMYADLMQFAHSNHQVVGKKNDYYVTLEQLENVLMKI